VQAGHGRVALIGGDLALLHALVEVAAHLAQGGVDARGVDVVEADVLPGEGADVRDSVAHGAGAGDADGGEGHAGLLWWRRPALRDGSDRPRA
jgi:hypothetical protein